jgi:hypothetical protein
VWPKALAAIGVFAAGVAAALLTVSALGWPERRAATEVTTEQRTYTLRDGDVAIRAEAATRCEASAEGGLSNLFCTRIPAGRHQIILYADCALVWPLARGPDGPPITYGWDPKRGCR